MVWFNRYILSRKLGGCFKVLLPTTCCRQCRAGTLVRALSQGRLAAVMVQRRPMVNEMQAAVETTVPTAAISDGSCSRINAWQVAKQDEAFPTPRSFPIQASPFFFLHATCDLEYFGCRPLSQKPRNMQTRACGPENMQPHCRQPNSLA